MTNEVIQIKLPDKLQFLLTEKWRYKVAYGGRSSGKSFSMIVASLVKAMERPCRILCVRQFQNSIADSVHKLISDSIYRLKLENYFTITQSSIRCYNGSEYIFKGIHNNVQEIKSLEGVDYCLCEESQNFTDESWEILIPTIRKEGSEFWICFNPERDDDSTYRRFVLNKPDNCKSVMINYTDNPWCPAVMKEEAEACKKSDYNKYEHIWLGKTVMETEAQIFKGKFEITEFEADEGTEFFYGADWGFACLIGDTMVATNKGDVPIKDIKVGDMVLTRDGYKKVLATKNKGEKEVFDVDFGYKKSIIATGDHRVFTKDGWKRVDELKENETVCLKNLSLMGKFIKGIQMVNTQITFIGNLVLKKGQSCIGIFGNSIMVKYLKDMLYTILTKIRLITTLKTLCVSLQENIQKYTTKITSVLFQKKNKKIFVQKMDIQKRIGQKEERSLLQQLKKGVVFVKNVVKSSPLLMSIKNFVARNVGSTLTKGIAKGNILVKYAVRSLWLHLTSLEKPVLKNVHIKRLYLKEKETVYDITVENGEFFANGLLVHNCDKTTLVRCFIENNCLFIDYEAGGVGIEMEELPKLFDTVPDSRKWKIRADCARPETISYVARHGFKCVACQKWKGSIEDGIEYIRSFNKIYIHPRCKGIIEEFQKYSYKKDRVSGDILPIVVDAWNHYIDALRYSIEPYIKNKGKMRIKEDWSVQIDALND